LSEIDFAKCGGFRFPEVNFSGYQDKAFQNSLNQDELDAYVRVYRMKENPCIKNGLKLP
jgi:hypothetical protein